MIDTIRFKIKDVQYEWTFNHNLESKGTSLRAAFENYIARTDEDKISSSEFVQYVLSKNKFGIGIKCKLIPNK
jgi:hypothetical protein